ncbi:MAG: hypothetical protein AB9M60_19430 [Leptothrix sp. (in: b-proteobacteria)]
MVIDASVLAGLLATAARLSGLAPLDAAELPPLVALPPAELREQACPLTPQNCGALVALFDAEAPRILVTDQLDVQDARDRSVLVHELVHVLERRPAGSGDVADCEASLRAERRAYRVQNAYLQEQGVNARYGRMLLHAVCASERVGAGGMLPLERQMRDEPALEAFMDDLARGVAGPVPGIGAADPLPIAEKKTRPSAKRPAPPR